MAIVNNDDGSLIGSKEVYIFLPLINVPNLADTVEELRGKRNKPLADIVTSYPASMKDTILRHLTNILDTRKKIAQKVEAQRKLNTKTDNRHSHIPGSLRTKNQIKDPGYLKDNEHLNEIVEEGQFLNEEH